MPNVPMSDDFGERFDSRENARILLTEKADAPGDVLASAILRGLGQDAAAFDLQAFLRAILMSGEPNTCRVSQLLEAAPPHTVPAIWQELQRLEAEGYIVLD